MRIPGCAIRPARKKKVPGRFKEDGEKTEVHKDYEGTEEENSDDREEDD